MDITGIMKTSNDIAKLVNEQMLKGNYSGNWSAEGLTERIRNTNNSKIDQHEKDFHQYDSVVVNCISSITNNRTNH